MLFRVSAEGLVRKDYLHIVQYSLHVKKYRHTASGIGYFCETVTAIPKYILYMFWLKECTKRVYN